MSNNWKIFWKNYRDVKIHSDKDLLYQVGKTTNKNVISETEFNHIVDNIKSNMNLNSDDVLLDLCCGNGILTKRLSSSVNSAIGVDFSELFIKNANLYSKTENITFVYDNIINFLKYDSQKSSITKILLYDCMAYFNNKQLNELLEEIHKLPNVELIHMGSVLDKNRIFNFYNTFKRKFLWIKNLIMKNNNGLGTWWSFQDIKNTAAKYNIEASLHYQSKSLYTSHYRFDTVLKVMNNEL